MLDGGQNVVHEAAQVPLALGPVHKPANHHEDLEFAFVGAEGGVG